MLAANALTTAERLFNFMSETIPANTDPKYITLQALINAVSSDIEKYISRTVRKLTYTQEHYSTERGQTLNLKNYPIDTTQPFILERRSSQLSEEKWEVIDSLYYEVDTDSGIIYCMNGVYLFRTRNGYRVTYTAGYNFDNVNTFLSDTDGGDLEVACWLIARDVWKTRIVPSNMYAESIGDYRVMYQRPTKGTTGFAFDNAQALAILDKYTDITPLSVLTPLQSI